MTTVSAFSRFLEPGGSGCCASSALCPGWMWNPTPPKIAPNAYPLPNCYGTGPIRIVPT